MPTIAEDIHFSPIDLYVIDFIRQLRYEKNLKQAHIAHLLNVKKGFIGNIESPLYRAKYNLVHVNSLAFYLDMSPRDFLPLQPFDPASDLVTKKCS